MCPTYQVLVKGFNYSWKYMLPFLCHYICILSMYTPKCCDLWIMVIIKWQWYFSYFFNSWKRSFLEFRKSEDVSHSLCLINSVNNVSLPWFSFFISLTKFSSVSKFSSKNFKQLSAISLETRSAFVAAITGVHLSLSCKKRDQYKKYEFSAPFFLKSVFSEIRVRKWVQVLCRWENNPLIGWPIWSTN